MHRLSFEMSKHGIALHTMSTSLTESKLSIASWHSTVVAKSEKQHVKKVYEISISSEKSRYLQSCNMSPT